MKNLPTLKETFDTYRLIGMTTDLFRKTRQKELLQYGINAHQTAVMQVLSQLGGSATTADISSQLLRERHSVHELLMRMVRAGFLKKINDSNRKNGVKVEFTEMGLKIYNKAKDMKDFQNVLSTLNKQQRKQLRIFFKSLFKASLENINGLDEAFLSEILKDEK